MHSLKITGSKSESNRALILNSKFRIQNSELKRGNFELINLSESDDTLIIKDAIGKQTAEINCKHSGAAIRFLAAHFASIPGADVVLTGSSRLKERPIKELLDALKKLGADIQYLEKEGFAPIAIKGNNLVCNDFIELQANISSQFITALLLISNRIKNGLKLRLTSQVISESYVRMTLKMLTDFGIEYTQGGNEIIVFEKFEDQEKSNTQNFKATEYIIESDWSSASYWYSMVSLGLKKIELSAFKENSLQGDAIVAIWMNNWNVKTTFNGDGKILLENTGAFNPKDEVLDFINCPDLAQTIVCLFAFHKKNLKFKGVESLKIKESNRIEALQLELKKINAKIIAHADHYELVADAVQIPEHLQIKTYQDHRMAMSFAPLALITKIEFDNPSVVSKSYPGFFDDLNRVIIFRD